MKVLHDIIDQVSEGPPGKALLQSGPSGMGLNPALPGVPSAPGAAGGFDDDDDDEGPKFKEICSRYTIQGTNILCIWDCCWLWIKVSELLAFIVFDPFTELFITLCIVVNVVFMALDQYDEKYDDIGGM